MPYIKEEARWKYSPSEIASNVGELNYLLTQTCLKYLMKGKSYQYYNDVIGALEACKLEFYRRACSSYEDKKIKENGDVYE